MNKGAEVAFKREFEGWQQEVSVLGARETNHGFDRRGR